MYFQEAKTLLPGFKVKNIKTGEVYVIDHLEKQGNAGHVLIYARHEITRKPVMLNYRDIQKIHLIDIIREKDNQG